MKKHPWFLILLAFFFSSVFWTMSAFFLYGLARQSGTSAWPSAQGEVLESRVVSRRGSKGGHTYKPMVRYRYSIGGAQYSSSTITFVSGFSDSGGGYARRTVAQFRAGTAVPVYYNPQSPGESVLITGVNDREWQILSVLGVFICVPAALWVGVAAAFRKRTAGRVGTVRVLEPAPGVAVVRAVIIGPGIVAAIAGFMGLITTVLATLVFFDTHSREVVLTGWGASLLAAAAFAMWRARWIAAGRCDTVIDRSASPPLLIPARGRRSAATAIPLSSVTDTALKQDSSVSTNKVKHWRVHLVIEGQKKSRPVADIRLKEDAETFHAWLRSRLGLQG